MAAPEWQVEQSWCQYVIESGNKLIINDARLDPRTRACFPAGPASVTVSPLTAVTCQAPSRLA